MPQSRQSALRARVLALLAWTVIAGPVAADVYVADADGPVPRFASHPTDASFRLLIRDEPTQQARLPGGSGRFDPATEARRKQIDPLIERIAGRLAVEPALVRAVIEVESRFHRVAVSPKGAVGPMQLMPATAQRYRVADRRDTGQNIEGGVAYLKDLLARFQGNVALALAAYNAGEGAVDRHGRVIPPYRETMLYVPRVLDAYLRYRSEAAQAGMTTSAN
jgi:soluble lytic murein transglycosylase-like protein